VDGWKHYAVMAGISLLMIALANSGALSFIPGMPPKVA
jgi:hypothetical protein